MNEKAPEIPLGVDAELGGRHVDTAYKLYKESLLMHSTEREQIAKRVKTKLDYILLPLVSSISFSSKSPVSK